jgi:Mg2+/Co2+ transporter CorB
MDGNPAAKLVNRLIVLRGRLIGTMLLGGQVVNIAASSFATSVLLAVAGDRGAVYATALMTVLIVIFGEVLPKTIAIAYPDRVSLLIAPIVSFFVTIFWPVVAAIEAFVRSLLWLCGMRLSGSQTIAAGHEELRGAVDLLHREGGVARSERDMFGALLELDEIEVSEVMIHRTNMGTINADLPPTELIREVLASPYTRLPLWRGQPDNIIGVLHAKDLFRALAAAGGDSGRIHIEDIALDVWFIPDTTTLRDQLQAFLRRKTHFAMVVDEYGVVMGLVTLEDIIEEIVGDIKDEHDVAAQGMRPQADGSVIVDGSVSIRDLNRAMDWTLPDEEATTIAGLVIHEARAIPEPRQVFVFHGFRFEVLRKNRNRIAALRISAVVAPKQGGGEKAQESEGDAAVRD